MMAWATSSTLILKEAKEVVSKLPKFLLTVLYMILAIVILNFLTKIFSK